MENQFAMSPNRLGLHKHRAIRTVDVHGMRANDLLDDTLLLQVGKGFSGQATVDLELVDKSGNGEETGSLDVLVQSVDLGLIEDNGVVGLVLNC